MLRSALLVASVLCAAGQYPVPPNPIFQGAPLLKKLNKSKNGILYHLEQGRTKLDVVHMWGTPRELGYAQGVLNGARVYDFIVNALDEFYSMQADAIPLGDLPAPIRDLVRRQLEHDVPMAFHTALGYVYDREYEYLAVSESRPIEEIEGLVQGVCDSGAVPNCDYNDLLRRVKHANMLPELIRMTCSMLGAWGTATPTGKLTQLRALDFGDGPFVNYSTLNVYHPDKGYPFTSVAFPGIVGVVTGFSTHLALSEKVWLTYEDPSVQPGSYDGLPVVGVIRDIIQFSKTKEDAFNFAYDRTRTWAVFMGVGDDSSQEFRAIAYRQKDLHWYGPQNISMITNFSAVQDVVFIDKHPQPSHDHVTMPSLVKQWNSNLTSDNVATNFPRVMLSGDVHVAVFDYGLRTVKVAFGWVDSAGRYGPDDKAGRACNQPFFEFSMDSLFSHPRP
eukprot:TRINITY_DN34098_c0_g1_i1.p1 TRINITY_DN34098_c0_g1~~TRINITY_DN34098_c0_g1_i1.p1  ORF type:complete len:446 (+),score=113.37 TRINITY_DN34098_c0_g1_i1:42-1379(+)